MGTHPIFESDFDCLTDMSANRVQAAERLIAEAEKHMKTSFIALKFSPDVDSAIEAYDKAAIQLKNASEYKRAIEVYLKVAAMNESRRSYFNAGKALDSASGCCRDLEDLDGVLAYADQAADLFRSNGQPDTAYHTLIRAAKHAEPKRPEASIEFYQKAANMYRLEGGRVREAADVLNRVACLQSRAGRYNDVLSTLERERELRLEAKSNEAAARTHLILILVYLKLGKESVARENHEKGESFVSGYDTTDSARVLDIVFEAIDGGNEEEFTAAIRQPFFRSLENDFVKLSRTISLPESVAQEIDLNATPSGNADIPDFNQAMPQMPEAEPDIL